MSTPASGLAQIGKSVVIKGELSGSEDLYLDGQVEGSIALKGNSLTVGPNGQVKAASRRKGVVVQGNLRGTSRPVTVWSCASRPSSMGIFRRSAFPSKKALS